MWGELYKKHITKCTSGLMNFYFILLTVIKPERANWMLEKFIQKMIGF